MKQKPFTIFIFLILGLLQGSLGYPNESLSQESQPSTLALEGMKAYENQDYTTAAQKLSELNRTQPSLCKTSLCQYALGESLLLAQPEQSPKSIEALKAATILSRREHKKFPINKTSAATFVPEYKIQLTLAEAYRKSGQAASALATLNSLLKQLPTPQPLKDLAVLKKAQILTQQNKLDLAKTALNIEIKDRSPLALEIDTTRFQIGTRECEQQSKTLSRDPSVLHERELYSLKLCFLSTLTLNFEKLTLQDYTDWCKTLKSVQSKLPQLKNDKSPQQDWAAIENNILSQAQEKDKKLTECYGKPFTE